MAIREKRKGANLSLRPLGNRTPDSNRYRCFLSDLTGLAARPPFGSRRKRASALLSKLVLSNWCPGGETTYRAYAIFIPGEMGLTIFVCPLSFKIHYLIAPPPVKIFQFFYASLISPLSDILFYSDIHFFELDFDKVISIKNLYYYDGVAE